MKGKTVEIYLYTCIKQAPVLNNHFFGFPIDACLTQIWLYTVYLISVYDQSVLVPHSNCASC